MRRWWREKEFYVLTAVVVTVTTVKMINSIKLITPLTASNETTKNMTIVMITTAKIITIHRPCILVALRSKTAPYLKINLRISCVRDCRKPSGLAINEYGDTEAKIRGGTDGPADGTHNGETSECICSTSWSSNNSSMFIANQTSQCNISNDGITENQWS